MRIYIAEDDPSVIGVLEDILESSALGRVFGASEEGAPDPERSMARDPYLVRVDLLYNKFPVKVRCGINIATASLVLICMGLVFIYGINIFLLSFRLNERISSVWGSHMWTIRFWVPLGAALMFIQAISELIKNVAAMAGKIELTNNSDEVAEAIEILKSSEHLPDETGKEDIQ